MTPRQPLHAYRFTLPIRTVSAANSHELPMARHRRVKKERTDARTCAPRWPFTPLLEVVLTRVGRGQLDAEDNLPMALKAVRDGLADWLGFEDDSSPLLAWTYRQRREAVDFFVEVEIRVFGPVRLEVPVDQLAPAYPVSSPPAAGPASEGKGAPGGPARRGAAVSGPPARRALADLARPAYRPPEKK